MIFFTWQTHLFLFFVVVFIYIYFIIIFFLLVMQTPFTLSNNWSPFWKLEPPCVTWTICSNFIQIYWCIPSFGFRLTLHLDAFHFPINNTIQNRLGDEETQLPLLSKEIPASCLPNLSPICLIGSDEMTNHVIYTSSEFEKMQFLKIQVRSITYLLTDILNTEWFETLQLILVLSLAKFHFHIFSLAWKVFWKEVYS